MTIESTFTTDSVGESCPVCHCHARRRERLDWDSLLSFSDIGGSKSYNYIKILYTKYTYTESHLLIQTFIHVHV